MKELISFMAAKLVDAPEAIDITISEEDDTVNIQLRVAQEDLGKVIGKQGRTARAMRAVLSAAAAKESRRCRLEILE